MDQLLSAILTVAVGLAVFLVGRRVTLWYFRINEGPLSANVRETPPPGSLV